MGFCWSDFKRGVLLGIVNAKNHTSLEFCQWIDLSSLEETDKKIANTEESRAKMRVNSP